MSEGKLKMANGKRDRLLVGLIVGWALCGIFAVSAIVATKELMWGGLPWWSALGWDGFLIFVAFALPVKIVILVDSLRENRNGDQ